MQKQSVGTWDADPADLDEKELTAGIINMTAAIDHLNTRLAVYRQHEGWRKAARIDLKRRELHELRQKAAALDAEIEREEKQ